MRRLAIDTSSIACTVALQFDGQLVERHEERAREHTNLLMPMIREVLDDARIEIRDLDAIVLGNGPGSFIGMRIAASVAQGLAHGAGIDIIPVSSLAAVAAEALQGTAAKTVAVAQDAHMQEIYLGIFAPTASGQLQALAAERLHRPGQIEELDPLMAESNIAAGQGWLDYPQLYAANAERLSGEPAILHPRARYLLQLSAAARCVNPADIEPAYLRRKVAETAVRDKS